MAYGDLTQDQHNDLGLKGKFGRQHADTIAKEASKMGTGVRSSWTNLSAKENLYEIKYHDRCAVLAVQSRQRDSSLHATRGVLGEWTTLETGKTK